MFIRELRLKKHFSQEQLAESCGLSLRTIQRVESGHRVSYASLRALADSFNLNVDELEKELYAMNNKVEDFMEIPLWIRVSMGRGWFSVSRREHQKIEIFFIISGILVCLLSGLMPEQPSFLFNIYVDDLILFAGIAQFFGAYWMSIKLRLGDKYSIWSKLESTQPKGIFRFF